MALFRKKQFDGLLILFFINLLIIGLVTSYSVSHELDGQIDIFDFNLPIGRQLLWVGISLTVMLFILTLSADIWKNTALIFYGASLLTLILVLIIGTTVKGARAWIILGPFSFQPAEFAKLGTLLYLSSLLSLYSMNVKQIRHQGLLAGVIFLPVGLILLQPDAGSALVFSAMLWPLFRAGFPIEYFIIGFLAIVSLILSMVVPVSWIMLAILVTGIGILMLQYPRMWIWLGLLVLLSIVSIVIFLEEMEVLAFSLLGLCLLIFVALAWKFRKFRAIGMAGIIMAVTTTCSFLSYYIYNNMLQQHQKERVNVWLHPEQCDPRGAMYNVFQSKLAIASGGFSGKGFLQGNITKLNYVPEQRTDFIYCVIAEEHGFIGALGVIVLFGMLVMRILQIAEKQQRDFNRYYGYGVAGILFTHFFVNIGMTLGLMPVIGIPLPFISSGGSSLLFMTVLIAVLLKLDYADKLRR